jgi:hypothetical protein
MRALTSRGTARGGRYRSGVGFDPYRKQVRRRGDLWIVAVALAVVALLVLWASLAG